MRRRTRTAGRAPVRLADTTAARRHRWRRPRAAPTSGRRASARGPRRRAAARSSRSGSRRPAFASSRAHPRDRHATAHDGPLARCRLDRRVAAEDREPVADARQTRCPDRSARGRTRRRRRVPRTAARRRRAGSRSRSPPPPRTWRRSAAPRARRSTRRPRSRSGSGPWRRRPSGPADPSARTAPRAPARCPAPRAAAGRSRARARARYRARRRSRPPSSSSIVRPRAGSAAIAVFARRSLTASATRCCWAPSWMLRSRRRRSSSWAVTIRWREARSSAAWTAIWSSRASRSAVSRAFAKIRPA